MAFPVPRPGGGGAKTLPTVVSSWEIKKENEKKLYLVGRPAVGLALDETLHVLPLQIVPPGLQEIVIVDVLQLDPSRLPVQLAEHAILVLPQLPVQGAVLGRFDPPGRGLLDVDVGHGRAVVIVVVLLDDQGDGGQRDGFSHEPANALLFWGRGKLG